MKPEISYITIEGQKTRIIKYGSGSPILFLHGWGCRAETMAGIVPALQDSFSCYLIDFPGFGESEPPKTDWHVSDYADFTMSLIQQLGFEKCDVLAHSFGCRVMLNLLSQPEKAKKFGKVLVTGGAGLKPRRKPSFYFKKYLAKTLKFPFLLLPGSLKEKGLHRLRQTALWKKLGSSDYAALDGVMRQIFVHVVTDFMDELLPKINHEVFLLWGELDDATPIDQAKRLEHGIKHATLVTIPDAGHYTFLDQSARFNAIARAYFTG